MSVKADVKIMLLKKDYEELDKQLKERDFADYEIFLWDSRIEERLNKEGNEFVMLSWNYIKWDYDTNEVVESIVDYIREMKRFNLNCRYISIYYVGTEDEICSYGKDPNIIPYIAGCMYIAKEIKTNDSFYELFD